MWSSISSVLEEVLVFVCKVLVFVWEICTAFSNRSLNIVVKCPEWYLKFIGFMFDHYFTCCCPGAIKPPAGYCYRCNTDLDKSSKLDNFIHADVLAPVAAMLLVISVWYWPQSLLYMCSVIITWSFGASRRHLSVVQVWYCLVFVVYVWSFSYLLMSRRHYAAWASADMTLTSVDESSGLKYCTCLISVLLFRWNWSQLN